MSSQEQEIKFFIADAKADKENGLYKMLLIRLMVDLCPDCRTKVNKLLNQILDGAKNE